MQGHAEKRLNVVSAANVKDVPHKFLWEPYLIDENINIIGGLAGTGKTWFLSALMAAVSTGQPEGMPGQIRRKGNALYIGNEDGNGAMRQRLKNVGADLNAVFLCEDFISINGGDMQKLIEASRPALIVIDPVMDYFPRGMNENSRADIQYILSRLRTIARNEKISIVLVVHPPKGKPQGYSLGDMYAGSGAFTSSVRTATFIGYHPTDRYKRVAIQTKNNICIKNRRKV